MPSPAIGRFGTGRMLLKYSQAEVGGPASLRAAVKVVLTPEAPVHAVGGVDVGLVGDWINAGAAGLGLGSSVFAPAWPRGCRRAGRHPCRRLAAPQIGWEQWPPALFFRPAPSRAASNRRRERLTERRAAGRQCGRRSANAGRQPQRLEVSFVRAAVDPGRAHPAGRPRSGSAPTRPAATPAPDCV